MKRTFGYLGTGLVGAVLIGCTLLAALAVVKPRHHFQFNCEQSEPNVWDCRWRLHDAP